MFAGEAAPRLKLIAEAGFTADQGHKIARTRTAQRARSARAYGSIRTSIATLRCDYCCVRSSPRAPRRELGLERVRQIASEAAGLGVREIFVTGGEPFLLADIGGILNACTAAAPTTVLTTACCLPDGGWKRYVLSRASG